MYYTINLNTFKSKSTNGNIVQIIQNTAMTTFYSFFVMVNALSLIPDTSKRKMTTSLNYLDCYCPQNPLSAGETQSKAEEIQFQ